MRIAVVAPSPVPFTIGGAENMMWGLCDGINRYTEHQCELIKLPVKEFSFWDLVDSYYAFYRLDLSHFDLIITSKYPSWMVKHDNSICYMMHTLRGLYDTYHLMGQPMDVSAGCVPVDELLDFMNRNSSYETLDEFFSLLYALKNQEQIPQDYFAFPGALIRRIIHYMDSCALRQRGVKKYCAISDTVKKRRDYFPEWAKVQTIYPPTTLKGGLCGEYRYIFMVSRLDAPKRIDLLIQAMKQVKSNVQLFIAGTGPQRENLEELAHGDSRIHFLGFVKDEEVEQYYANSLVVPYFPSEEDYGYITIEAMMHKKPVITTVDAGGPTEFVHNGETGYVVSPNAVEIAAKIDYFAERPEKARELGENGYALVKEITWEKVVHELLKKDADQDNRKKIVVTSTFPIYPPQGGGQARTYNLYKNIARDYDVEIVSFEASKLGRASEQIATGLCETRIPKSEEHQNEELKLEMEVNIPVTDIAMITLSQLTPEYGGILKKVLDEADYAVISHPYLYPEAKKYLQQTQYIYEAQDVEYIIKRSMLPVNETSKKMLDDVYETEKECCQNSAFIMTCSEEDRDKLSELYDVSKSKIIVVPNGVDCSATAYVPVEERMRNKEALGLKNEKIGLFMGSWHGPNLEACQKIFEIATKCPGTKFLLMGSQCLYFQGKHIPDNVGLLGLVSEEEKNRVFSAVDFALNPMLSGSGTNLKMFDYMSAGIPIITTQFGTRGIDRKDLFIISEVENIPEAVNRFDLKEYGTMTEQARRYTEEKFDWGVIAQYLMDEMERRF